MKKYLFLVAFLSVGLAYVATAQEVKKAIPVVNKSKALPAATNAKAVINTNAVYFYLA